MHQPITLIVPIHAKPECRDRVKARLTELAAETRREKGNLFYLLHEVTNQPDRFVIYERWADQAALDFHMRQGYLVRFLADCPELLAEAIAGMNCREIDPGRQSA
jgi:quinol monooxygenase YgiN